jgi:hypothetical protein
MVNTRVMKFRCTLNFLQMASLAVMCKFLNGYKTKQRDNEAGWGTDNEVSSNRETICQKT